MQLLLLAGLLCAGVSGESASGRVAQRSELATGGREAATAPQVSLQDNPGRRRRSDARRRTHQEKPSPEEAKKQALVTETKILEFARAEQAKAAKVFEEKRKLTAAKKKVEFDEAKARVAGQLKEQQQAIQKEQKKAAEARTLFEEKNSAVAENSEAQREEIKVEQKTTVLRSAIEEAVKNVNDALKFVAMVKNGEGMKAYRQSFLAAEHKNGGAPPGGFARLTETQLNTPWLTNLNKALAAAKYKTNYENVLQVQKLLDVATQKEQTLERGWKKDEEHRASVNEAMQKNAKQREVDAKYEARTKASEKARQEVTIKREAKEKRLRDLKEQTAALMRQASEIKMEALQAEAAPTPPKPAKKGKSKSKVKTEKGKGKAAGKPEAKPKGKPKGKPKAKSPKGKSPKRKSKKKKRG